MDYRSPYEKQNCWKLSVDVQRVSRETSVLVSQRMHALVWCGFLQNLPELLATTFSKYFSKLGLNCNTAQ